MVSDLFAIQECASRMKVVLFLNLFLSSVTKTVDYPLSHPITSFSAFSHNGLENIQEINGLIICDFITTRETPVENVVISTQNGIWYNILGQPVDPHTYKGIAIQNGKKYLLR